VPAVFWLILSPRGRLWGIVCSSWRCCTALTLPATLTQLQVLFAFRAGPRGLFHVWALVPWAYRHPEAFRWLMPSEWLGIARTVMGSLAIWRIHWRRSPERTKELLRRIMRARVRAFLGIGGVQVH
jgi:hypothetical protein